MIESFLNMNPFIGLPFLAMAVLLSSLGAPIPGVVALMLAGAFVEAGEMSALAVIFAASFGASIGDQIGYQIGFHGGNAIEAKLAKKPANALRIAKAKRSVRKWGGYSVYFSRWLLTPLGPTINLICGASDMRWRRFTFWSISGETTWAVLFVSLGYIFASNIETIAYMAGDAIWMITAGFIAILIGYRLVIVLRNINAKRRNN